MRLTLCQPGRDSSGNKNRETRVSWSNKLNSLPFSNIIFKCRLSWKPRLSRRCKPNNLSHTWRNNISTESVECFWFPPPSVVSLRRHPWVHPHQNHDNPYLSMSSECHRAWSQHRPQRPTGRRRPQTRTPSLRFSAAELSDSSQVSSTFKAAADGQGRCWEQLLKTPTFPPASLIATVE